jgi:hypothetical protein
MSVLVNITYLVMVVSICFAVFFLIVSEGPRCCEYFTPHQDCTAHQAPETNEEPVVQSRLLPERSYASTGVLDDYRIFEEV